MNKLFQRPTPSSPPLPTHDVLVHPFYPIGIEIANYVANDRNVLAMLGIFLGGWAIILGSTWVLSGRLAPHIKILDRFVLIWFVLTGTIHLFFEGYFALNHTRMGAAQDLFGQLWKEYSLSDSRYLVSDPFVLCMETITAFLWGPLSYAVVYLIATDHPLRHPMQALVSTGQIYGDVLYYATSLFDLYYKGLTYCRPEPYYFWFYFFFMNFIWIVVPGSLLYQSFSVMQQSIEVLKNMPNSIPLNGSAKTPIPNGHLKHQ